MTITQDEGPLQSDWPALPAGEPPPKHSKLGFFKELPVLIVIAFGLALIIKSLFIQAFFIPSESMVPTLEINDRVLVNKLVYRFRNPHRGEVIVFVAERDPRPRPFGQRVLDFLTEGLGARTPGRERDFIKRVIGLPDETIEYRNSTITITKPDGAKVTLDEPYAQRDDRPYGPFKVPPDHYFVMGDNRQNSSDSRFSLGPIKKSDIVGKAFVRIWPPSRLRVFGTPNFAGQPKAAAYEGPVKGLAVAGWAAVAYAIYGYSKRRRRAAA